MYDEQHLPPIFAPSVLSANFTQMAAALQLCHQADCLWWHLDVMDGHFVPNLTFGPKMVADIRALDSRAVLDVHLMIDEPQQSVDQYIRAGADWLTFHLEACLHHHRLIAHIKSHDKKAGIAIVPSTPVSALQELLPIVDLVLVLSVNPGFGGQALIPQTLAKLTELRRLRAEKGYRYKISIDGGVNDTTLTEVAKVGPDVVIAGTAFFEAADPAGFAQLAVKRIKEYRRQGFQPKIITGNENV